MSLDFEERDRTSVIADLRSDDEEVRRLAVERVAALPLAKAIPHLVERLGDLSWRVRKAAVERLVASPDTALAATGLIGALADGENPGRRNAAVEALVRCGQRALAPLLDALGSVDDDVRKLVVDALAGIGDAQSAEPLIGMLSDPDPNVRAAAADALGAIGGDAVGAVLRESATRESEDTLVRFSALRALATLAVPVPARALSGVLDDPVLRPAALALLGSDDDPEAEALLLKALSFHSRASREAAIRSLLRAISCMDPARAEVFSEEVRRAAGRMDTLVGDAVERLDDAELGVRLALVQFLGLLRAEAAVVPILLAARDEAMHEVALGTLESMGDVAERAIEDAWGRLDSGTRRDACVLFGRTRGERGAARLLVALADPAPPIRAAAARSIGERRLGAGLALLVHHLEDVADDEDFETEEEVAALTDALIALAAPSGVENALTGQAVELLASRIEGASDGVRLAIARVLGRIGRREDSPVVTLLLKDPEAPVRHAAVDALARLDPGTHAEPLRLALADESPVVRIAAAGALGASESDEVIDDLRNLSDDEDPLVRAAAVRALGLRFARDDDETRRETARQVIDRALGDAAPVALATVETLNEIGGGEGHDLVALLERSEPELLREVVRWVGSHGHSEALEALIPVVSHPDWSVRAEAISALAERRLARAAPAILRRLETEQDDFVRDAILRALKRLEG